MTKIKFFYTHGWNALDHTEGEINDWIASQSVITVTSVRTFPVDLPGASDKASSVPPNDLMRFITEVVYRGA